MSVQWYYTKNGQKIGPITDADLKQLAISGNLSPSDQVWKEGMAGWTTAGNLKGLFSQKSSNEPEQNTSKIQDSVDKIAKTGQSFISKIGSLADKVGSITGEAINYDQNIAGEQNTSGIVLKESYFGGRQSIGTSLQQLETTGGKIMAGIFSFIYIGIILYLSLSSWIFLPYSKTEFIKISLRQSLRWEKFMPIITGWFVTMTCGFLIFFSLFIIINKAGNFIDSITVPSSITEDQIKNHIAQEREKGNIITREKAKEDLSGKSLAGVWQAINNFFDYFRFLLNILAVGIIVLFYIYSNLQANSKVSRLANYTRTAITLDYGFPNKVRLLETVTDSSIDSQIESVLSLCSAIEKAQFASWETVNHDRNNGIRTYLASLARRFTG